MVFVLHCLAYFSKALLRIFVSIILEGKGIGLQFFCAVLAWLWYMSYTGLTE